ncbi:MAG: metallophosphoesterase family protein [Candidatus Eremiobacteraeota bacterium]|nr:metallophosphoesterase family protein [Candidatus Eremiobacteraeota bacterium]
MRVLVVADIHANYDALAALPDSDLTLCAGDTVTFGALPSESLDWLRERRALAIRGEEDDAVANGTFYRLPRHIEQAGIASRAWTRATIAPARAAQLASLPPEYETVVDGYSIAMVHAYPGDYNRYLGPSDDELDRLTRAFPRAQIIVTAHTHRQSVRRYHDKLIVNPGSVGMSSKGGHAAFVLIEHGNVTFASIPYDVERAIERIRATPLASDVQDACIRELTEGSLRPYTRLPMRTSVPA